jgi:hypothetical protein
MLHLKLLKSSHWQLSNVEFIRRQLTTHLRHSAMDLSFPIPVIEIQTQKYRSEPYIIAFYVLKMLGYIATFRQNYVC